MKTNQNNSEKRTRIEVTANDTYPNHIRHFDTREASKAVRRHVPKRCKAIFITSEMIDAIPEHNPHIADWKRRLQETRERLRLAKITSVASVTAESPRRS